MQLLQSNKLDVPMAWEMKKSWREKQAGGMQLIFSLWGKPTKQNPCVGQGLRKVEGTEHQLKKRGMAWDRGNHC